MCSIAAHLRNFWGEIFRSLAVVHLQVTHRSSIASRRKWWPREIGDHQQRWLWGMLQWRRKSRLWYDQSYLKACCRFLRRREKYAAGVIEELRPSMSFPKRFRSLPRETVSWNRMFANKTVSRSSVYRWSSNKCEIIKMKLTFIQYGWCMDRASI